MKSFLSASVLACLILGNSAFAMSFPSNWTCTQGDQTVAIELRAVDGVTPVAKIGDAILGCDQSVLAIDEATEITCHDALSLELLSMKIVDDTVQASFNGVSLGRCSIVSD